MKQYRRFVPRVVINPLTKAELANAIMLLVHKTSCCQPNFTIVHQIGLFVLKMQIYKHNCDKYFKIISAKRKCSQFLNNIIHSSGDPNCPAYKLSELWITCAQNAAIIVTKSAAGIVYSHHRGYIAHI